MISPIHDRLANALSAAAETIDLDHKLTFKPMFGGYMAYYDGKVFASLSNIGLALKFSPAVQAELLLVDGAARLKYELDSPPSKQYIVIPDTILTDPSTLSIWLKRSLEYISTLPGKKPKV